MRPSLFWAILLMIPFFVWHESRLFAGIAACVFASALAYLLWCMSAWLKERQRASRSLT